MVVLDCQEGETKISKEVEPILGVTPWRARLRSSTKLINHTVLRKLFRSYLISELAYQVNNGKLYSKAKQLPCRQSPMGIPAGFMYAYKYLIRN